LPGSGKKLSVLLLVGSAAELNAISERTLCIFQECSVTVFIPHKTDKIYNKQMNLIDKTYYMPEITGKANLDNAKIGIKIISVCKCGNCAL
jgi:hypothetical protein